MSGPRGLETRYAGCRFRSRLEARWALALDWLGITREYEREGYGLPEGSSYLPDFYLPADDIHVEVKGGADALRQAEPRLAAFAAIGHPVLVLADVPDPSEGVWPHHRLLTPDGPREARFVAHGPTGRVEQLLSDGTSPAVPACNPSTLPPQVARAYRQAREARFEHGATPARPTEEDRSSDPPPSLPTVPNRRHNYA